MRDPLPEVTILAVAAVVGVAVVEIVLLRTGVFRRRSYWLAMAALVVLNAPVASGVTRLPAAFVVYDDAEFSGRRFPWDVPLELHVFVVALGTLAVALWERAEGNGREG